MLGLTANKTRALSATNRQNNKRCCLRAHIEQTVNTAHHSCRGTALSRLQLSARHRRACVWYRHAEENKKFFFNHLSDLNSVSSCTVVISRALQGSKDQCSWCLPPSPPPTCWNGAHYSSSPYQQGPAACVTPLPIADLWLRGSWVLAHRLFSQRHVLTLNQTKAQIVRDPSSTRGARGSRAPSSRAPLSRPQSPLSPAD